MGTAERDALNSRKLDDFIEPRIAEIQSELALLENNREVDILQERDQEDLFLTDLAQLREEATRLRGTCSTRAVAAGSVRSPGASPSHPIKPKKRRLSR